MSRVISAAAARVAAELTSEQSQAKHLWSKLRANQADCFLLVSGDSTGNEASEWVYKTALKLAAKLPTHSVIYRLYVDGAGWAAPTTLQVGSGARTLYIDNASIAGTNTFYAEGGREASIWGGRNYDQVVINYGHNLGTDMTEEIAFPEFMIAAANARLLAPYAGLLITLQNPRTSVGGAAYSARMVSAWRKVADLMQVGVIDVYSAFKAYTDPSGLYADETHTSPAGSDLWAEVAARMLAEPSRLSGGAPSGLNPLTEVRPNFAPNPRFADWPLGAATPTGWVFNNCTAAKDPGASEGGLFSLQIVVGAGADPSIKADVSASLPKLRGKPVTFLVRMKRPAGMDLLAGRIGITSTDGVTSASATSYPRGQVSVGGWEWAMVCMTVPRAHTSLLLTIYAGGAVAGTDTNRKINIESALLCEGMLPGAVGFEDAARKTIADFYADGNVGPIAGATGTLTATAGTITLVGATVNPDTFINVVGITPGKQYRVSWGAGTCTGNVGGALYVRNGANGGSSNVLSTVWAAGSAGSAVFTAPAGACSVWISGYGGTTGYAIPGWSIKPVDSGMTAVGIELYSLRSANGDAISTSVSGGRFATHCTPGVQGFVFGESAISSTVTSTAVREFFLPADYVAGRDFTVTVSARTAGTGVWGATRTIAVSAFKVGTNGLHGANLGPVAQNLNTVITDHAFTISGATLAPGDRVMLRFVTVLQETGGSNTLNSYIGAIKVS